MRPALVVLLLALVRCRSNSAPPFELAPIASASQSFVSPQGPARTESFVVDRARLDDPTERRRMVRLLSDRAASRDGGDSLLSLYVYRRTEQLTDRFDAGVEALRGGHRSDLLVFGRWTAGRPDMLYVLEDSHVVFDLLADAPEASPWEFR